MEQRELETKKDKGFTLIELLIVIVILGILATVVVFAVRGVTDDSQENACKATQKTYQVAIEAWYAGGETGNPTGALLESEGYIRDYDATAVVLVPDDGTVEPPLVGAAAGGDCVNHIANA